MKQTYCTQNNSNCTSCALSNYGRDCQNNTYMPNVPRTANVDAKKVLSVPDKHQLRIAYKTLKMSKIGATIMGGMTHQDAIHVIYKLTGKIIKFKNGMV